MPSEMQQPKRGRPCKKKARTPSDFNEIILKVANSPILVPTPLGNKEMSFFELNVTNTASDKASTRIGARAFVDMTKRAALEERSREERAAQALAAREASQRRHF